MSFEIGDRIDFERDDIVCFACDPTHGRGLHMEFVLAAESAVECTYTAPTDLAGAPGVVHGGLQATMLDEAMGYAAHVVDDDNDTETWNATAELSVRYLRPVHVGEPLTIRGELVHVDGRDRFLVGTITGGDGTLLTRAEARYRELSPQRP